MDSVRRTQTCWEIVRSEAQVNEAHLLEGDLLLVGGGDSLVRADVDCANRKRNEIEQGSVAKPLDRHVCTYSQDGGQGQIRALCIAGILPLPGLYRRSLHIDLGCLCLCHCAAGGCAPMGAPMGAEATGAWPAGQQAVAREDAQYRPGGCLVCPLC